MYRKILPEVQKRKNVKRNTNKPMKLKKIEKFLRKSKTYIGAFFVKSFKKFLLKAKTYSLIGFCNSHWFCVYSTDKTLEVFDPVGFLQKKDCLGPNFFNFLKANLNQKTLYCNPPVQSVKSFNCGYFVIFYILMREAGYSFIEILAKFSQKLAKNDKLVTDFAKTIEK